MRNVQLLCKLVLIATLLILAVPQAKAISTSLVINEIMYDPAGTEVEGEWVEIYVQSSPGSLDTWTITDQDIATAYNFPNFTPADGEYIIIHIGVGTDDLTGPVYHLYMGRGASILSNTGDDILLTDGVNPVDYVAYGSGSSIDAPPGGTSWDGSNPTASEGKSVALKNNGVDSDSGDDWEEAGDSVTIGPASQGSSNNVTVIKPGALNNWGFLLETGSTGDGEFVTGPDAPPVGLGSVRLTLDSASDGMLIGAPVLTGLRLDAVTNLEYSTYVDPASTSTAQVIALQFNIDDDITDADNTWKGRLIFEPYYTEPIVKGTWQTWDPLTQGKWWGTHSSISGSCSIGSPCTWVEVLTNFPDAGIHNILGAVLLKAGSGWPAGFDGNADALTINAGDVNAVFDFEPELSCATDCYVDANTGSDSNTGTIGNPFATIQKAIDTVDPGGTVHVAAGTYNENLIVGKQVTLQGAQMGVNACGRAASESIISGTGTLLTLQSGSAGSIINGFTFSGGSKGIESTSGPLDDLQILNNRFTGFTGSGVFLNDSGDDITVNQNEIDGSSQTGSGGIFHLDQDSFDGFHFTNNCILNGATGFFVDGNHNVGQSLARSPLFENNLFDSNGAGANFGRFAVEFATVRGNTFSNNSFDGLQGGVQNSLITQNTFSDNDRAGLRLTGFGGTGDATRGAQDNTITNNFFVNNGAGASAAGHGDVRLDDQFDGAISTNVFFNNSFASTVAVFNNETSAELVDFSGNWWGDNTLAGIQAKHLGSGAGDIDFTPWLDVGVDTDGATPGFQGDFSTLHVDDDSPQSGTTGRIQEGINLVTASTVLLGPGTYVNPAQVVIDKNVTVIGAGTATTIIKPGFDTGSSGDARGWWLVDGGIEFHLSDLTMDGTGKLVYQAIRHKGEGSIDNVVFKEIKFNESGPHYAGTAVAAFGAGPVDISNSEFSQIGRVGVLYFGSGISGSTFSGNTYTGKGAGDWLDYALDISNGATVVVEDNQISDNLGVASSDGSISAGILVTTFFGPGTAATVTNNTISNSTHGVHVGFDGTDTSLVTANFNNFIGNGQGVSSTAPLVDATLNWWNAASGPGPVGPGSGDGVSANVIFCPWLDAPFDGGGLPASFSGGFATTSTDGHTAKYCTIEAAMFASSGANQEVHVEEGNWPGEVMNRDYSDSPDLLVKAIGSAANTVVNGINLTGSSFDGLTFENFTITSDAPTPAGYDPGYAVEITNNGNYANLAFKDNIFDGQNIEDAGAIFSNRGWNGFLLDNNHFINYNESPLTPIGGGYFANYSLVFMEAQIYTPAGRGNNFVATNNFFDDIRHLNAIEAFRWQNVTMTHNQVTGTFGRLLVWSYNSDPLLNVNIADNEIDISAGNDIATSTGIGVYYVEGDVNIADNKVTGATTCLTTNGVSDLEVKDNEFSQCAARGHYFSDSDFDGAGPDSPYVAPQSAVIMGNTFKDSPVGVENVAQTFELNACLNTFINITEKRFENPGPFAACGNLQVFKYKDLDREGDFDAGEPGLQNWSFTIYDAQGNEVTTITTDANGLAEVELPEGDYTVCEDLAGQPNWVNSDPGTLDPTYNAPCKPVTIIGNGGGSTPGPSSTILTTTSGGEYQIEFLGVTDNQDSTFTWRYRVTETSNNTKDLSHWVVGLCDTNLTSWDPTGNADGIESVDIGLDPTTGVTGIKWNTEDDYDEDGNDDGDSRIFSFTYSTSYAVGATDVGVKTGGGGADEQAKISTGQIAGPDCEAEPPEPTALYFGNHLEPGNLEVTKYNDEDKNGQNNGEAGLPGWTFNLYRVVDNSNQLVGFDSTDQNGQILDSFDGLEPGDYLVCELIPANGGWVSSDLKLGQEGAFELGAGQVCKPVTIEPDQTASVSFGNYQAGSITIIKEALPTASWLDWTFDGDFGPFTLDTDPNSNEPNQISFVGLDSDTYIVNETNLPGNWELEIVCGSDGGSIFAPTNANGVSIQLAAEDDVTCLFKNKRRGQIKIIKYNDINANSAEDNGDSRLEGWQMFLYVEDGQGGWTQIQPREVRTDANGVANYTSLEAGKDYLVCEEDRTGWVNSQPGAGAVLHDGKICQIVPDMDFGQVREVIFGNYQLSGITFVKVVEGGNAQPGDWSFDIAGGPQDIPHNGNVNLQPGEYTVTEDGGAQNGLYNLTGASGVCALDNGQIKLTVGEGDATCTVTNSRKQGTITFIKEVIGGEAQPTDWSFDVAGGPQNIAHTGQTTLDTGEYTVTESGADDYDLTGASGACALDNGQIKLTVTENGGECKVTNTYNPAQHAITFVKVVEGGDASPSDWSFEVSGQAVAHNGQLSLVSGEYTVTEDGGAQNGLYNLTGASGACALDNGQIKLTVGEGDATCTVTNSRKQGTITFIKEVIGGEAQPTDWSFDVAGGPQNIAHTGQETLATGSYIVAEDGGAQNGLYDLTGASGACALDNGQIKLTVTENGGECKVTNTRKQKEITFVKVVEGGSAQPGDWSFDVADGPQDIAHNGQATLDTGSYIVTENGDPTYAPVEASGACSLNENDEIVLTVADEGADTCTVTNKKQKPTAIGLVDFSAQAGGEGVTLSWTTGTETDNAGFNIYRATAEDGPYTQINSALIAAQGDGVSGASYQYVDTDVEAGATYFYKLEDVDLYGETNSHGPVSATTPSGE